MVAFAAITTAILRTPTVPRPDDVKAEIPDVVTAKGARPVLAPRVTVAVVPKDTQGPLDPYVVEAGEGMVGERNGRDGDEDPRLAVTPLGDKVGDDVRPVLLEGPRLGEKRHFVFLPTARRR